MRASGRKGKPHIVYVINSFDHGGAEFGLVKLIGDGMFDGCSLTIAALARGTGEPLQALRELGHQPIVLCNRMRMRSRDLPRLAFALRRLIAREAPDVVIGSLPQANLLGRLCVMFNRRIKFISFEHNTHLAKKIYEVGYWLTSGRVDWVLSDAQSTLDTAIQRLYRHVPQTRIVVPLVSFSEPAVEPRKRTGADECFQIVNAARFTGVKNQAALIRAAALLLKEGRNVKVTLFGDGPLLENCKALAGKLGVNEAITFPGHVVDWADWPADLFVLTSRHEGLCMAVLEAMHAGIPVLAPIVGGLKDYTTTRSVRVLSSTDPSDVASAISTACDNRQELEATAVEATRIVNGRFGRSVVQAVYRDVAMKLLGLFDESTVSRSTSGAKKTSPTSQRL